MNIKKNIGEPGLILLEGLFGILISLFVMMFLLSLGFFLYQHTTVHIIANEIAEEVALKYKHKNAEYGGDVFISDLQNIGRYRYLLFGNTYDSLNESKAWRLAAEKLEDRSLARLYGQPSVTVQRVPEDIGRMHFEVTVSQQYEFLLSDMLELFGIQNLGTVQATAYVEGVDVSHYINTVKAINYGVSKITEGVPFLDMIDKVIGFVHAMYDIVI